MALEVYRKKRDFSRTPEPAGETRAAHRAGQLLYVIQKHAARQLHYDFRLELDGVLKSWAVPKGPSLDPGEKRLAVQVEDHPLEYGEFEGAIPKGEYGGGTVLLWDRGTWMPLGPLGNAAHDISAGKLKFLLAGEKLRGAWMLVRLHGARAGERGENWLLIKERDDEARPGSGDAVLSEQADSVASGQSIEEIAANPERVWSSKTGEAAAQPPRRAAVQPVDPAGLPGARKAAVPASIAPQLATPAAAPPRGDLWLHEIKFDGYRVICRLDRGKVKLLTRTGKDWTDRFGPIARAVAALSAASAILDGEVVVLQDDGLSSFQALQEALSEGRGEQLVYLAFDLLYLEGYDLRGVSLDLRKQALATLLSGETGPIRWSDHVVGQGEDFFRQACAHHIEGILSKRSDLPYLAGRQGGWVKVKCLQRQEFVIGGYTDPGGARSDFGALLVGFRDGGGLRYAGRVGTGFSARTLRDLHGRLRPLERASAPFANPPSGREARGVHWVEPRLVAEVAFSNWTRDDLLRQPSFQGLREDKDPEEVVRELPPPPAPAPAAEAGATRGVTHKGRTAKKKSAAATTGGARATKAGKAREAKPEQPRATRPGKAPATAPQERRTSKAEEPGTGRKPATAGSRRAAGSVPRAPEGRKAGPGEATVAGVRLSHPQKVLYPGQGFTKLDLARYYERIAGWVLPHLRDRPLTLVRCPDGEGKQCFYQKHVTDQFPASILRVELEEGGETVLYGAVDSVDGLVALVQMGVLEVHLWGAHRDHPERPDYLVFDLDPDLGLAWERVAEAALLLRELLAKLGLRTFLKTTGGKGLHVVLPLARRHGWDEVKAFTKAVAEAVAASEPARYTTNPSKAARKGKIYVDFLRNQRGATSIAPYSTRSRPGAPVSVPLHWEELEPRQGVRGDSFNIANLPARLEELDSDPWADFGTVRQSLTAEMKRIAGI